jgi:hypothetical protein
MKDNTKTSKGDFNIKNEVSDPAIIQAASLMIDEWEARLPYSPMGTFSQDTTFVKMIDHSCLRIEIESQVVNRTLRKNHIPDDGNKCLQKPISLENFDPWAQEYPVTSDFREHESSFQIEDTRERIECDLCEGSGKTTCVECSGTALIACGKNSSASGCGGSGQIDITKDVREWKTVDESGAPLIDGGEWRIRKEVIGTKNCAVCHGSGQVKCQKCKDGLVQCDRCEGKRKLIRYTSVEQKESSIKGETTFLSYNLPSFRSVKNNPTSMLRGHLCFTQDEFGPVNSLDISQAEEREILEKAVKCFVESDLKYKESIASGKVFRQVIKVYNCPVSEYFYTFNGTEFSIFVNRESKIVEDLTGPIAQESANLLDQSKELAKEKKYLRSFAANQKAKTLLSSNPWEIKARKALVDTSELGSLGIEKSKQLFSKFFKK